MAKLFRAAIMGPPGSGKGTISQRIAESFGLKYLSSGHYLRDSIAANTEAGMIVRPYVDRGMLVPDHVMTRLMLPRLEQLNGHSWLLDGFPRTVAQAQALNSLYHIDMVISLNIPYATLSERLSDRWIHPASGRVYNMGFNPPQVQGKDDITGEPLIQHDDDKPEALMARLRHYKDVAKPVIDLYKSQGVLHSFSGTDTDKIWPYINSLLSTKMQMQPSEAHQTQTP
ncbi:adenylate kinase 4, mitochondrial isoform X2 [Echeneis naucrates]|uniref:GTP:AMP phosphotransferase AK3, mitochondrial n=2 Tax=Echeneis naucrates TaxID=173247 RepID=A0A665UQQ6_ECHNA|nr:adenylate kinase 4, mitochondrial isoform X2 [Echeneis naucrates]XP_029355702.1 adenylate kinase 4, mitochondrial isoform X2 [Echeneis naucrates]